MGGAYAGVAEGAESVYWNPAGLSGIRGIELGMHHNSWLGGALQENLVAGFALGRAGVLAVTGNYVGFGDLEAYDANGARSGTYTADRLGAGLAWGRSFSPGLALGLGLKGQSQSIAGESLGSFSGDLGVLWDPSKAIRLGLAYANLGMGAGGASTASSLRLGVSGKFDIGKQNALRLALGGAWQPSGVSRLQAGLEDQLYGVLTIRAGYESPLQDPQIPGLRGLALGLGARLGLFRLDYAYQPYGDLGSAQQLSLGVDMGGAANKALPRKTPSKKAQPLDKAAKARESLLIFRKQVDEDRSNASAWKSMGKAYIELGRKDYAAQSLREAVKLSPEDVEAAELLKRVQP